MPEVYQSTTIKSQIEQALRDFVEEQAALLIAVDPQLTPVAVQLRAAVAHGKRLRAAFCYWGWRASGQPDSRAMIKAAAAMELVHAAAVVHDDLIDDSPLRHGVPTAHIALCDAVADGPARDAAGRSLAMLVGDLLMAWAGQLFLSCGLPTAYLARAQTLWAILARELIAGECLEILRTGGPPSVDSSLEIIRYKTAKYSVEHPLLLGGKLAGAPPGLLRAFSAYGVPLGEAFQLRDDLLGVFGDPAQTGKSNMDDIAAAKPTALLAIALSGATSADRIELENLVGRGDLGAEDIDRVRAIMERSGARARVEEMIAVRVGAARSAIGRITVSPSAAEALGELLGEATARTS